MSTSVTGPSAPTVLLCMQTKDNFIDLFWHDDMLHSKQGEGDPVKVHIPGGRGLHRQGGQALGAEQTAPDLRAPSTLAASAHFIGGITIGENAEKLAPSTPTSAPSATRACT